MAVFLLSSAARAATVIGFSDILTRLQINVPADHEIKFVSPSGVDAPTDTITLNFQLDFNLSTVDFNDVDLAVDTDGIPGDCSGTFTDKTLAAVPGASPTWGAAVSGQTLTLTPPTNSAAGQIAAGSCIRVRIGKNAVVGPTGTHQIVNPSITNSTDLTLGGGFGDKGTARLLLTHSDQIGISAVVPAPSGGGGGGGGCTATLISNVRTANPTETSIDVLWDTDISSTRIVDYGLTTTYGNTASPTGSTFTHDVQLTGLTVGTLYHFRVRSSVACGTETASADFTFGVPDKTPPVMSNILCQNMTGTSFSVIWDTNEDTDSRVDYGFSAPFPNFVASPTLTNAHSLDVTGLTPDSTYRFRTTSKDASSNSAVSAEFTCKTLDTIPPVITNVSCDAITSTSFRAKWATGELSDSKVDYGLSNSYGQVASNASLVANHQIVLTPLLSATTYHYKVTSRDAVLNSASSTDFICTTLGDITPPANVRNFTAFACSTRVSLNWLLPADGDFAGTKIQRSTASNPATPAAGTSIYDATGTALIDTGLPNEVTQYYTAFSHDSSGNYASGALQSAKPSATQSPLCPANIVTCGNTLCETGETPANCAVDCPVVPVCYLCERTNYDVYIINPDLTERHTNTPWVRLQALGNSVDRVFFEDATLDPHNINYDFNDAIVDVDTKDCSKLKFTFVSSDAGWDHQLRYKVLIDGIVKTDNLLTSSTKSGVGTSKTVNAGAGLNFPMCPLPGTPAVCGNNLCEATENHGQCPADCPAGPSPVCGNDLCEQNETPKKCPADCHEPPPTPTCGNHVCDGSETHASCAVDCPTVPYVPTAGVTTLGLDPDLIHYFALSRILALHHDADDSLHTLQRTSFSIDITGFTLPKPASSIILDFDGGSYNFTIPSADEANPEYWVDVTSPSKVGAVVGSIIIVYTDGTSERIPFTLIVEPPGQVYEMINDQRVPITGATVTLYKKLDTWVVWSAGPFLQNNPSVTGTTGLYAFMAPPGDYYLTFEKDGYRKIETSPFNVSTEVINRDMEMLPVPKPLTDYIVPGVAVTENLGNIANGLGSQSSYVTKILQKEVIQNPQVKTAITQFLVPAVAVITAVVVVTAIQGASLVSYLYFLITQPILLLWRRRRKEFGTVYNSLTKRPVDLAIVRLIRTTTNKLVRTIVTDKQGRYAFLVDPGEYRIEASKKGFSFPSLYLKDRKEDSQYIDLYHGEIIHVGEKGAILTANIPMDPLEIKKSARKLIWEEIARRLQNVLALSGAVLTLVAAILYRQKYLYILTVLQIALFFLFRRLARPAQPKNWGIIYDSRTKKPIPFAIARIVETQYSKVLESRVTDSKGRYNFLVGNNKYVVTVEKPGYNASKTSEIDLTNVGKEGGVVSRDIAMTETEKKKPEAPVIKEVVVVNKDAAVTENQQKPETPGPPKPP